MADPGFPVGGRGPVRGGRGPLMQALFGKNVCENKRIGSHGGVRPANGLEVADPGFPLEEGAPTFGRGAFRLKCVRNRKNWTPWRGGVCRARRP